MIKKILVGKREKEEEREKEREQERRQRREKERESKRKIERETAGTKRRRRFSLAHLVGARFSPHFLLPLLPVCILLLLLYLRFSVRSFLFLCFLFCAFSIEKRSSQAIKHTKAFCAPQAKRTTTTVAATGGGNNNVAR